MSLKAFEMSRGLSSANSMVVAVLAVESKGPTRPVDNINILIPYYLDFSTNVIGNVPNRNILALSTGRTATEGPFASVMLSTLSVCHSI